MKKDILKDQKKLFDKLSKFNENKCEIALLGVAPYNNHYELIDIKRNPEDLEGIIADLKSQKYKTKEIYKTIGNMHNAYYLNDIVDLSYNITKGINRTLEFNTRQLLNNNNKNSSSGYIAVGFSLDKGCFISTRLYNTPEECMHYINKRQNIDSKSIIIIDTSRFYDGSFRFSDKRYENIFRLKDLLDFLLEEKYSDEAKNIKNLLTMKKNNGDNKIVLTEDIVKTLNVSKK